MSRRFDLWLPTYLAQAASRARARLRRRHATTHLMFLVCDHFEPRHGAQNSEQPFERVRTWHREYARFQQRCRDSFGTAPLHSWFYPPHHGPEHLARLARMAFDGLGEVELHYHHHGDTEETLRSHLRASIDEYRRWGLLLESGAPPSTRFGFVHGDWALGNSCGGDYCGVNDELTILQELGCWGDFTMPSGNRCQTRKINSIYYGVGDPARPKAHDWGPDARVGQRDPQGLLLMQGPLAINWRAPDHPRPENGSLTTRNWGRPDRIPTWIDCNVHVQGKPEWLFIKLHTHGAIERDFDALFGEKAFEMHRVLNEQFNDGERFRLHYVTAREAYNIAKAAENGEGGSPSDWLDYRVKPPATRFYAIDARHEALCCTDTRLTLAHIEANNATQLGTRVGPFAEMVGALRSVDIDDAAGTVRIEADRPGADVVMVWRGASQPLAIDGGMMTTQAPSSFGNAFRLRVEAGCTLRFRGARDDAVGASLLQRTA